VLGLTSKTETAITNQEQTHEKSGLSVPSNVEIMEVTSGSETLSSLPRIIRNIGVNKATS
jgi:hypothetical protein